MDQYVVDVFTNFTLGTKFPENSYGCNSPKEVAKIVKDCSRKISGIVKVEVWINYYDDGEREY